MRKTKLSLLLACVCALFMGCNGALNQPADISKSVDSSQSIMRAPEAGKQNIGGMDFIITDASKNDGKWLVKIPAGQSKIVDISGSIKESGKYVYLLHAYEGKGEKKFDAEMLPIFADGIKRHSWVKGERDCAPILAKPQAYDNALPVYKDGDANLYLTRYVVVYAVGGARPSPVSKLELKNKGEADWYIAGIAVSDSETMTTENFVFDPKIWKPIDTTSLDIKEGSALDLTAGMTGKPCGIDGRVVLGKSGKFEFANKPGVPIRFKGTNLRLANRFPVKKDIVDPSAPIVTGELVRTHEDIDEYVKILKKQGYNAVRWRPAFRGEAEYKAPYVYYEDIQDMYDYYIYALKREGVYIFYYLCSNDIGDPDYRWDERQTVKVKMMLGDKRTRASWVKLAKAQLEHVNPYTGMALKDDPVVATLEYWNEFEIGAENFLNLTQEGQDLVNSKFREFIEKRYGTVEKFLAKNPKWITKKPIKSFDDVDLTPYANRETLDYAHFVIEAMRETTAFWENTIRKEIGMKAPIHQNNCNKRLYWSLIGSESGTYNAINTYHCHPSTYQIGGIVPDHSQMRNDTQFWRSTITRKVVGMPTAVTEYQHCHFNPYKYEAGLIFPAYSAYQDYDALIVFDAAVAPRGGELGYFNVAENPIFRANDFINYFLFYRGDVKVSPNRVDLVSDKKTIETNPEIIRNTKATIISLMTGFANRFPDARKIDERKSVVETPATLSIEPSVNFSGSKFAKVLREKGILSKDNITDPDKRIYQTDTGEITMRSNEYLVKVVTPKTEAVAMRATTKNEKLGNLTVKSMTANAAFALSSLDNKPLVESDRLVLTIATDTAMKGSGLSKNRLYVTGWGKMPVLIETGKFSAELKVDPSKKFVIYPLKLTGERMAKLPLENKNGILKLDVDTTKHTAVFFEIEAVK